MLEVSRVSQRGLLLTVSPHGHGGVIISYAGRPYSRPTTDDFGARLSLLNTPLSTPLSCSLPYPIPTPSSIPLIVYRIGASGLSFEPFVSLLPLNPVRHRPPASYAQTTAQLASDLQGDKLRNEHDQNCMQSFSWEGESWTVTSGSAVISLDLIEN